MKNSDRNDVLIPFISFVLGAMALLYATLLALATEGLALATFPVIGWAGLGLFLFGLGWIAVAIARDLS